MGEESAEPRVGVERVRCAACGGDAPRPYRAGAYRIDEVAFDLVRCARCGLVYVDPRPDPAALARMYDDPHYFTEGYNLGVETECYFDRREELLALYDGQVAELQRETGREAGGDLLELGSAGGFLLEAARRRGLRARGVELSEPAWRFSVEELGLDVFRGQLEDAPFPAASFDLAVADNVLEHTTDPLEVLRRLRELLRPGGHLLLVVPSYVNSAWYRGLLRAQRLIPRRFLGRPLLKLLKFDAEGDGGSPPYHILEFDRPTLLRLVRAAGLELVGARGSVPLPAHLFKIERPGARERFLRGAFRAVDLLMRLRLAPPARLRVLVRRPG